MVTEHQILQFKFFDPAAEMLCSIQRLLLLYFTQNTIASANIIHEHTLDFQEQMVPDITMRPTIQLRGPTIPEPTTSAPVLGQNSACMVVGEALAICISLSPGFIKLQPTAQAHCLCYSSTSWMPGIFDNAVKTCADYASTAVAGSYQPLANLEGFCQKVGDVEAHPTVLALTTLYETTASISAFSGQPCNSVNSVFNGCASMTPGFSSLQRKDQAKCLCYVSSTSWCPTAFDNAVATCASYAQTADSNVYSTMCALGGFCAGIGNILTTTLAPYGMPSTLSGVASEAPTPKPSSTLATGGGTSTSVMGATITIGGPGATRSGTSGGRLVLDKMGEGGVIAISFGFALLLLFL